MGQGGYQDDPAAPRVLATLASPAVAAGVELERWDLERVVEMTAEYNRRKEDAVFEEAFAEALGE